MTWAFGALAEPLNFDFVKGPIANVGDQESDRRGGYAERAFKLPNPFYLIP